MKPGIICLDKPENMTSFSAVARVRRIAETKKAGHAGTLDPMATGVLPVMLSGATRFIEFLETHEKSYTACVKLGITTDTLDITGTITSTLPSSVERGELETVLEKFKGTIMQLPPMYSAVHSGGKRLYELARSGIEIEREAREINISKLELIDFNVSEQCFTIDVTASKGTYIRSLAHDIGQVLGCGAVLTSLRRTYACGFHIENCITLDELEKRKSELDSIIIPIENALVHYPSVNVSSMQAQRFKNGGELDIARIRLNSGEGMYRVFSDKNEFLGLGITDMNKNALTVKRILVRQQA